jgi:hypothetical protein
MKQGREMGTAPIRGLGRKAADPAIVGWGWEGGTDPVTRATKANRADPERESDH